MGSVLFSAVKEKNYGGVFQTPITKILTTLARFVFVDDTDLLQTQHLSTDLQDEIVVELRGSLDVWKVTLLSSDGTLDCDNPNKSYWYGVDYE